MSDSAATTPSGATPEELLAFVERDGAALAASVKRALEEGVSEALVLPTLFQVFADAGMMPAGLDLGMILGMLK